jgi:gamma-glutamyl-gamma-aminobutyrate hydrolase PuuD
MIVGLTQRVFIHNGQAYDSTDQAWYRYLEGHTPVFISNVPEQDFKSLANRLDCLIITGGDDSTVRRLTEIRIATEMLKLQKPIVGICHGCFLLTEMLGGTVKEVDNHYNTEHTVYYNNQEFTVNSYHSLSIRSVTGQALVLDQDDNVEAWIDGNIAGVVWHPERMNTPWLPNEITQLLSL